MKKLFLAFLSFALLTGCPESEQKDAGTPAESEKTEKAALELQPAAFDELVGWHSDDWNEILPLWQKNCARILKIATPYLDGSAVKIATADYQEVCRRFGESGIVNGEGLKNFIEENFLPYLVLNNGNANGKFTSYYEARIYASRRQSERYPYPIYGRPADLVDIDLQDFDPALPNRKLSGRVDGKKLIPYYTRAEIENNGINAPVLLWGNSAADIHIMQIQGSAVALLEDGMEVRIGYDGNNGRPFRGIGSILLGKKLLKPGQANMAGIKKWLRQHPREAVEAMQENQRYIFHRFNAESGPIGTFQVPLTGGRSLAVDRSFIPLGSLLWLNTTLPGGQNIHKLMAAQDTGSAIKGPVRGDYFWGSGGDDILDRAGSMNADGQYFILLPKGKNDERPD